MDSMKRTARLAGLFYLVVVLTGPFVLLYVPGKIFVPGDATATAANLLAHETLFRSSIVIGLVSELCFLAAALLLYRLLRGVDGTLAFLMALLIFLVTPVGLVATANEVATLAVLHGDYLVAFDAPQRAALATLLVEIDRHGVLVSELFWGLWLLPLGILIHRSKFLPRWLGVWLFANGLAYVAISTTGILVPQYLKSVSTFATPILFGEMALMLWLLIVGVRVPPAASAPPHPG
ncbi:MAG: DUF4386 domain-containing protein [Thermoanaerobaculia bacterium]